MTEPSAPRWRSRRWLLALLLCVIAIAAAAYFALNQFTALSPFAANGGSDVLAPTERLIPVRFDSLRSEISINGSIAFSNKEHMTFGSAGFIDEILVSEGEIVSKGQPLARLDSESISDLLRDVAQARLDYAEALDKLGDAKQPALQLAQAEATVAGVALELHNAQEALDALINPPTETIAAAESTLAYDALELHNAQESLDALLNPPTETIAAAQDDIAQAKVTLHEAEFALSDDVVVANNDLEIAVRDLVIAQQNLNALSNSNNLKDSRDTYDEKRRDYANIIYKWTGVEATDEDLVLAPDALLKALDFNPEQVYSNDYTLFPDGRVADNPNTRWNELKIFGWRALFPGISQIEFQCDQNTLIPVTTSDVTNTNAELCIERDMRNAYDAFQVASNDLLNEESQHDDSVAQAKQAVTNATKARSDAKEALDRLADGNISAALLQTKVTKAQADLAAAIKNLEDLTNPNPTEVETLRKQVALAQATHAASAKDLETLTAPDHEEIAAKRSQIALAQANLDAAKLDLLRLNDRQELQITLQEGMLAAAQAKIDGAIRRYDESTITAPWNGYITYISAEAGKEVEPFEIILTVVNSGIVQIEGRVDEIDVLSLQRNDAAIITMDALPDQTLEGIVSSISSTANNQQGIVTFDVKISVNLPDDITLQEGLTAIAKVPFEERSGILVPMQSVQYDEDQGAYVRMQDAAGFIVKRPITLGDSDGFYAIVESGLAEGDQIVMKVLDDNQTDSDIIFEPDNQDDGSSDFETFDEDDPAHEFELSDESP